ncbi:hypothetical protein ACOMHN_022952 [Nucella lapillus]
MYKPSNVVISALGAYMNGNFQAERAPKRGQLIHHVTSYRQGELITGRGMGGAASSKTVRHDVTPLRTSP